MAEQIAIACYAGLSTCNKMSTADTLCAYVHTYLQGH